MEPVVASIEPHECGLSRASTVKTPHHSLFPASLSISSKMIPIKPAHGTKLGRNVKTSPVALSSLSDCLHQDDPKPAHGTELGDDVKASREVRLRGRCIEVR